MDKLKFKPMDIVRDTKGRTLVIYSCDEIDQTYSSGIISEKKRNKWSCNTSEEIIGLVEVATLKKKEQMMYEKYKKALDDEIEYAKNG